MPKHFISYTCAQKNAPGRQTAEGAVSLFLCQAANGIDCSLYQL